LSPLFLSFEPEVVVVTDDPPSSCSMTGSAGATTVAGGLVAGGDVDVVGGATVVVGDVEVVGGATVVVVVGAVVAVVPCPGATSAGAGTTTDVSDVTVDVTTTPRPTRAATTTGRSHHAACTGCPGGRVEGVMAPMVPEAAAPSGQRPRR
jgi:hypothetical protein